MMLPGSSEWLIILGITVLIFGPKKLPQLGGAIGETLRNFKKGLKSDAASEEELPRSETSKPAEPLSQGAQTQTTQAFDKGRAV